MLSLLGTSFFVESFFLCLQPASQVRMTSVSFLKPVAGPSRIKTGEVFGSDPRREGTMPLGTPNCTCKA